MLKSRNTKPCGSCQNFAPSRDPPTLGHCWGGPIPWRNRSSLVHGCGARHVLAKRWNPEKQWHYPEGSSRG